MNLRIDLYLHSEPDAGVTSRLDQILTQLAAMAKKEIEMDAKTQQSISDLNDAVAKEDTIEKSFETLANGQAAMIAALKAQPGNEDPTVSAAIDAAVAILRQTSANGAANITANTPQA